jgi:hypothetical protein
MLYICLVLVLAILPAAEYIHSSAMFKAALVLRLLITLPIAALSTIEHSRNLWLSTLSTVYLCLTLIFDAT